MSNICKAIENLPHRFITPELVMEAAREHDTELLDHLPQEHLTMEVVNELFSGESHSYHWKFDLSVIPVEWRTAKICHTALRCSTDNLIHVPAHIVDEGMVEIALASHKRLQYLSLIPLRFWTEELVVGVMKAIDCRHLSTADVIRRCHVVMALAPENLKTREFYHSLFSRELSAAVIAEITPARHRDKNYYRLMAAYDVRHVPIEKLNRELILVALGKRSTYDIFRDQQRRERIFGLMDDGIADALVTERPASFAELPEEFQTSARLIVAVKSAGKQNPRRLDYDDKLLTLKVVKEFVRQGVECGIPEKFWCPEFAEFCARHTKSFFWFAQMPKGLQTKEMVTAAIRHSHWNLRHALKQHITREIAVEVVRAVVADSYSRNNLQYIPESYFTEFKRKTGLPEKFMGGEVDFATLKEQRKRFTYCRIGNIYAGLSHSGYRGDVHNLIVSRVEKGEAPKTLYEGAVTAFHKTWLEKPIAENDEKFFKPTVDPSLKDVQGVSYYGVETLERRDGFDIYANTFCRMTVGYCVKKDGLTYHDNSIEAALAGWRDKVEKAGQAPDRTDEAVFTAEMLHRKYGFCEIGMTAFANDYGLDYNGRYSVGYLRQTVALHGPKPSLRTYSRELRQIGVIL